MYNFKCEISSMEIYSYLKYVEKSPDSVVGKDVDQQTLGIGDRSSGF